MRERHGLHFSTQRGILTLDREPIDLDVRQQRLLGMVALASQHEDRGAEVTSFRRVRGWSHLNDSALKNAASRLLMRLEDLALPLVTFAPREKTKHWQLNTAFTGPVTHDLADLDALSDWVFEATVPRQPDTLEATRLLLLAATAFEQGRNEDAEQHAQAAFLAAPSPDQHLRAMALVAWVKTSSASYQEGWAAIRALQAQARRYSEDPATRPSREVRALTWIQTARFHMRKVKPGAARAAYTRAARLLGEGDHREWGAIEAGLGYLAQQGGDLPEATQRYHAALEHFTRGYWPWAMHVQYNNLAAVTFEQHAASSTTEEGKVGLLAEAVRWSLHARDFATDMDFGGGIDIEVNLAYAYRLQGRLEEAAEELRRATNSARASGNLNDLALVAVEQAELAEANGQRLQATLAMREAATLLRNVGVDDWTQQVERRLAELEKRTPLTAPIKLW